jgi:hypothetical protein
MNCYAWNIPEGCYASALDAGSGCPSPTWFWIALAVASGLLILGSGTKRKAKRTVRAKRK